MSLIKVIVKWGADETLLVSVTLCHFFTFSLNPNYCILICVNSLTIPISFFSMLVNGCISAKDLKNIIDDSKPSIKTMENRINLKRPSSSGDSTYGTDSEEGSSIHEIGDGDNKPVRKRANLDHLSPEEMK